MTITDEVQCSPARRTPLSYLLEAARLRRGWSTYQAAEPFGVNQSSFYRWETGQSVPGEDFVPNLAAFLGLPEAEVNKLRSGVVDDLRVRTLEREVITLRDDLNDQRRRVAELLDIVTRLIEKIGPPGPAGRSV